MKIAICDPERKFTNRASLLGLNLILLLLIFTPYVLVSFGLSQSDYPSVKNIGSDSFSEISRQLDPVSTSESFSDNDNNILMVQFDQVLPQQQFSEPPLPDTNTGSDTFSDLSRP